jgi:hypothetical protein
MRFTLAGVSIFFVDPVIVRTYRGKCPRLIQIRLTMPSLAKITPAIYSVCTRVRVREASVSDSIGIGYPAYGYGYYPYGYYRPCPYYGYYSGPTYYWYNGHRYWRHHRHHHYYRYWY